MLIIFWLAHVPMMHRCILCGLTKRSNMAAAVKSQTDTARDQLRGPRSIRSETSHGRGVIQLRLPRRLI
jgi:hypothetical protein